MTLKEVLLENLSVEKSNLTIPPSGLVIFPLSPPLEVTEIENELEVELFCLTFKLAVKFVRLGTVLFVLVIVYCRDGKESFSERSTSFNVISTPGSYSCPVKSSLYSCPVKSSLYSCPVKSSLLVLNISTLLL